MLASPLTASIKAQGLAAVTTVEFIERMGLEESTDPAEPSTLRTAEFKFTAPVPDPANPGGVMLQDSKLTVPILSIIPIPYIRINDLNVSFEFKIRDVSSHQSKFEITGKAGFENTTDTEYGMGLGGGVMAMYGVRAGGSVESKTTVTASVSATYQATNRHMTDRSATFKMTMNAVQDAVPEGLARVLAILNDAIVTQKSA